MCGGPPGTQRRPLPGASRPPPPCGCIFQQSPRLLAADISAQPQQHVLNGGYQGPAGQETCRPCRAAVPRAAPDVLGLISSQLGTDDRCATGQAMFLLGKELYLSLSCLCSTAVPDAGRAPHVTPLLPDLARRKAFESATTWLKAAGDASTVPWRHVQVRRWCRPAGGCCACRQPLRFAGRHTHEHTLLLWRRRRKQTRLACCPWPPGRAPHAPPAAPTASASRAACSAWVSSLHLRRATSATAAGWPPESAPRRLRRR